jgi:UDP-N-acetyl-D-glucosamine dehydrogenase
MSGGPATSTSPGGASEQGATPEAERLHRFVEERWTAGVVGLGYVGLPLAVTAAERGLRVIGYDISTERTTSLSEGRSHIDDIADDRVANAVRDGAEFTTDAGALAEADAIFIAVPSPLGRNRQPDMSFIANATEAVQAVLRPGQLISLESTTYPGTTEDYLVRAVERAGLRLDDDVAVAFSPERVDPGNALELSSIPKVVGGVTPRSGRLAEAAYGRLFDHVHVVGSAATAEFTKLLENTYRAVNIALVNELAQVAEPLGIDIWEVIGAAATKPFGYHAFYPGPGVGGHCIPLDPQFLAWRARELALATRFIDLAEDVNRHMPNYVVARIQSLLNRQQLALSGARVLGVGAAYKANVSDDRESPALDVLRLLRQHGAIVGVLDPLVSPDRLASRGFEVVEPETLGDWDVAVILTDHDAVDYGAIATTSTAVFDTRDAYRRRGLELEHVDRL